jgi:hypothetical protein
MTIWKDILLVAAIPIGGAAIGAGAAYAVLAIVAFRSRRRARARLLALSGRVEGQPHASSVWSRGKVEVPGVGMDERTRQRCDLAYKLNLDIAICAHARRPPIWLLAGDGAQLPLDSRWIVRSVLDQTDEATSER